MPTKSKETLPLPSRNSQLLCYNSTNLLNFNSNSKNLAFIKQNSFILFFNQRKIALQCCVGFCPTRILTVWSVLIGLEFTRNLVSKLCSTFQKIYQLTMFSFFKHISIARVTCQFLLFMSTFLNKTLIFLFLFFFFYF